jgi:hypothetical protein
MQRLCGPTARRAPSRETRIQFRNSPTRKSPAKSLRARETTPFSAVSGLPGVTHVTGVLPGQDAPLALCFYGGTVSPHECLQERAHVGLVLARIARESTHVGCSAVLARVAADGRHRAVDASWRTCARLWPCWRACAEMESPCQGTSTGSRSGHGKFTTGVRTFLHSQSVSGADS